MLNRMERFIRAEGMIPPGSRVLCALSGGADSVCLLGALYELREKLGFSLLAAHYNHNLRGEESLRDENFVRELLKTRFPDVELHISGGDVSARAREMGTGLEETARELRYAFLRETARNTGSDRIATAHTADDNAETVLLHLARGTGLQGLTGIAPVRGSIIRPLLTATRQDVEDFLSTNDLPHVEDSSNCDDYFARNRVRHQVIPVLEGLYPGFSRRLTENTAHLRADSLYLTTQAEILTAHAAETEDGLSVSASLLAQAPDSIALRAVRQLLERLRGGDDTCAASHLEAVLSLCRSDSPSGKVHLPGGLLAFREYDALHLTTALPHRVWDVEITPCVYEGQTQTGQELWLSLEKTPGLSVRTRQEGDTLKLPGRPTKSLKKWLIDLKIPRHGRDNLPVLTVGGRAAAAALVGPDEAFLPAPGEDARHIVFVPQGQTGKEL